MTDCVFCKIRDGRIPSLKVYEDEATLAFMDINPLNPGHCLVVPKRHAATLWDADVADLQAAVATAQKVAPISVSARVVNTHSTFFSAPSW